MLSAKEFRGYASECRQMARNTRDLESKATWYQLAERWSRCAALEERRAASIGHAAKHRRKDNRRVYRQAS